MSETAQKLQPAVAGSPVMDLLDSFKSLEDGWNSYSAPAPSPPAVENAKALVSEAKTHDMMPDRVEPSAMGGVGVTFSANGREVVIEFYNHGAAHALFANEATGAMHTQPVSTDPAGYQRIIGEVRKYIHGR